MSADQTNTAEAVERPTVDEARLALSRHLAHLASIEPSLLTPVETMRLKALSVFIESHDRLRSRITELEKALEPFAAMARYADFYVEEALELAQACGHSADRRRTGRRCGRDP